MTNARYSKNFFLIFIGIVLKIILIFTIYSELISSYFVPFIDSCFTPPAINNFLNVYERFHDTQKDIFPYPAGMLYYLTFFKLIFFFLKTEIAIKIAILFADFIILAILLKLCSEFKLRVIVLYWFSPVLIYINYIHGQLDAIPVAFMFVSLLLIIKGRYLISMILLSTAISMKTNILLALPFFTIYLFFDIQRKLKFILLCVASLMTFVIINIGFIFDTAFIDMVFNNDAQSVIFNTYITFADSKVYLVIVAYLILLYQAMNYKIKSGEVFILFLTFGFSVLILLIKPMPGWYYWVIPFLIYFYVTSSKKSICLFYSLQIVFLLYLSLLPTYNYMTVFNKFYNYTPEFINMNTFLKFKGVDVDFLINIVISTLNALLILNIAYVYRKGLNHFVDHKLISKPLLIGIGGNSGAGKSTFTNNIIALFEAKNVTRIFGDDMHKWERNDENWKYLTHLNPKANNLHKEYVYLSKLKKQISIRRQHYDHDTGKFIYFNGKNNSDVIAKKIIVYDGLHPFYIKRVRDLFDIKIFINPDKNLAMHWKIVRDCQQRGYDIEKVKSLMQHRQNDYDKYIVPQGKHSDISIEIGLNKPIIELGNPDEELDLNLTIRYDNSVNMEKFIRMINESNVSEVEYDYDKNDKLTITLKNPQGFQVADITNMIREFDLSKLGINKPLYYSGINGVIQVFLCNYIFEIVYER